MLDKTETWVAVAREESLISLYELNTHEMKAVLAGHSTPITSLAIDEEERFLVSGDYQWSVDCMES